jgi:hypothetical protein
MALTPSGVFDTAEVDVRIVKSVYVPCRTCHWLNVCTVPKGEHLQTFKEWVGDSSIHYHNRYSGREERNANVIVYHCLEYTVKKIDLPRGY